MTDTYKLIKARDAYRIQRERIHEKTANGAQIVGKKIRLISVAMQQMFQVNEPDSGHLLDDMLFVDGAEISLETYIQLKLEFEIAFVLKEDVTGPEVSPVDVV